MGLIFVTLEDHFRPDLALRIQSQDDDLPPFISVEEPEEDQEDEEDQVRGALGLGWGWG